MGQPSQRTLLATVHREGMKKWRQERNSEQGLTSLCYSETGKIWLSREEDSKDRKVPKFDTCPTTPPHHTYNRVRRSKNREGKWLKNLCIQQNRFWFPSFVWKHSPGRPITWSNCLKEIWLWIVGTNRDRQTDREGRREVGREGGREGKEQVPSVTQHNGVTVVHIPTIYFMRKYKRRALRL